MSQSWVIIKYGGRWIKDSYVGGERRLLLIPPTGLLYVNLLSQIQTMVGADVNRFSYMITSVIQLPECDSIIMNILNDVDLKFVLNTCQNPKLFVVVSPIVSHQPNGFIHLLNAQDDIGDEHIDVGRLDEEDHVGIGLDNGCGSFSRSRHLVPPLPDNDIFQREELQTQNKSGRQWTIPGALYQASLPVDASSDLKLCSRDSLSMGSTYYDKESMVTALGLYHLTNRVEYAVARSSPTRFSVKCKYPEQCNFIMHATAHGTFWRVIKWNVPHTCHVDFRRHAPRTLSSKIIGAFFAPVLMNDGAVLKPKEMASKLRREYGFHVDYSVALSGRNHAIKMVHGDPNKSFQLLSSYLYMVQQCNPGSVVDLETDSEDRFRYAFMALGASIHGFLSYARPVIVLDATHLKGKYKGVMFVAATMDGNEQVFPLAVGLGDKENDNSWTWFLRKLKTTFNVPDNLLFISDQHLSIKNAIQAVYPGTPHGLCAFHLQNNLARFGAHACELFQNAAYSYRGDLFQKRMDKLALIPGSSAFRRLMDLDPCRWALSQCVVRRYSSFMTSNCAEVINSRLRWARKLPVCTLFEFVRTLVAQWFSERRTKAVAREHELTEWAMKKLQASIEEGRTMDVEPINAFKFKVVSGIRNYTVDLIARSCSCREFDLDLIPCPHAAASIYKLKQSCLAYVSSYYTTETLRNMYSADVNPIPHWDEWCVPMEVTRRVVRVPENPKQAGRPRIKRIRGTVETSYRNRKSICSRCNKPGHYRSTCKEEVPIFQIEDVGVDRARRRPKKCSICHETGHTRRTCSLYNLRV